MKKLRVIATIPMIFSFALLLSACGKEEAAAKSNEAHNISFIDSAEQKDSRCWLVVETSSKNKTPIDKNEYVKAVIQTKDGKAKVFKTDMEQLTLEKVSKMSDEEIIEQALNADKQKFNDKKKSDIDSYNATLDSVKTELGNEEKQEFQNDQKIADFQDSIPKIQADIEEIDGVQYSEPEWEKVSATIKMDNENKSPSMETIKLSYKYLDSPIWNLNSFGEVSSEGELSYESTSMDLKLSIPVATTKVLDNFYSGYSNDELDQLLLTKVASKDNKVLLDSKGKNVSIVD
ncbi:hypothetical protein [Enterococcus sp. HMSC076E04]|uniref:hypothetical protein n=1 Tax=Enterococcus sp. HMSC076E04 TaxID=1739465 RepID=UPI0008A40644|nr:hypothetical protein [Enterococcus sp. HMSC076E04]OFQ02061.1 hypothetical protein HMPREF2961_00310 [Enterococcus sp. HMSC076E04]